MCRLTGHAEYASLQRKRAPKHSHGPSRLNTLKYRSLHRGQTKFVGAAPDFDIPLRPDISRYDDDRGQVCLCIPSTRRRDDQVRIIIPLGFSVTMGPKAQSSIRLWNLFFRGPRPSSFFLGALGVCLSLVQIFLPKCRRRLHAHP